MSWIPTEDRELLRHCQNRQLFFTEIAQRMGRSPGSVRYRARQLGLNMIRPEGRNGEWNRKHAHLREEVLRYFKNHSFQETAEHFGLSRSELKSCFTYAYREPKFSKIRKDRRRKDSWTVDETLFLIRTSGIQPRKWIASKLNRGGVHSVKEQLSRLNIGSKHLHGMPQGWLLELLGPDRCPAGIKTEAGPPGRYGFQFVVVPWVDCERLARRYPKLFDPGLRACIRAMAKFQRWAYGTQTDWYLKSKLRKAAKGEMKCPVK